MTLLRRLTPPRPWSCLGVLLSLSLTSALAVADAPPPAVDKPVPENVKDLREIQDRVQRVLARVLPCTVGIRIGSAGGSGVIVSKDGYVLTAGHVVGGPDRDVMLILSDGRRVRGKTLGVNYAIDSGMIQITEKGEYPFVEMGDSSKLKKGQWCLTLGHPGGYRPGRTPPVRLGRLLYRGETVLRSDCTLVGGDSGGPLFDLDGKVIGIHSRIGGPITANLHVPVDTFRVSWDRLVKGETWGGRDDSGPYLGFMVDPEADDVKILRIEPGSPAEKAGLKADDVVLRFEKEKINSFDQLRGLIRKRKPGAEVTLEVRRGEKVVALKAVIGKRGGEPARPTEPDSKP